METYIYILLSIGAATAALQKSKPELEYPSSAYLVAVLAFLFWPMFVGHKLISKLLED